MTAGFPEKDLPTKSVRAVATDGLTRTQIVQYAGASGDFNPIHTDEPYAVANGYPSVFAHGMLTMGMTGRVLADHFGHEAIDEFGGRFVSQVWPGDRLTVNIEVADVDLSEPPNARIAVTTTNGEEQVVFEGYARVRLAPKGCRSKSPDKLQE